MWFAEKADAVKKLRAKVMYSYTPQNDDELALTVGSIIDVLAQVIEWPSSIAAFAKTLMLTMLYHAARQALDVGLSVCRDNWK